jgi:hypothetical protein
MIRMFNMLYSSVFQMYLSRSDMNGVDRESIRVNFKQIWLIAAWLYQHVQKQLSQRMGNMHCKLRWT